MSPGGGTFASPVAEISRRACQGESGGGGATGVEFQGGEKDLGREGRMGQGLESGFGYKDPLLISSSKLSPPEASSPGQTDTPARTRRGDRIRFDIALAFRPFLNQKDSASDADGKGEK